MAFDTFVDLDGIAGESTDDKYKGKIEIYSFSLGASNPTTIGSGTTGSGAGKVHLSEFNFMKKTDSASPKLFLYCCNGNHIAKASVFMRKSAGDKLVFVQYDFTDLMVSSVQWSGSTGGDDSPTESVSLGYHTLKITYTPQKSTDGTGGTPVIAGWNQTTNVKL